MAWFNPHTITNIFSYSEMAKQHCITYNSETEDACIVHLPDKQVKFTKTEQGLYIFKPKINKTSNTKAQFFNTIDKNKNFFTCQQVEKAKRARELYYALGTPSLADFKSIIRMNLITSNLIMQEDIAITEQVFEPDISSLKGKTTRKTLIPVVNNYIKIPQELFTKQDKIILCIYEIKVNGLTFLTTISKNIFYRTAQFIDKKTVSNYTEALREILQVYNKARGIKQFGHKSCQATHNEMKQFHNHIVFKPIAIKELSAIEKRRTMESLIFLTEKKDRRINARTCANGSTQCEYTNCEEATSPTAMTESHLITAVINTKQSRDIITTDIPNTFVQRDIQDKPNGEKIIMKIQETLVNMLVDISPNNYQAFVQHKANQKILYVEMKKALYRMLQSSLLYYKKFWKDLEGQGFKINPYNPCVANRTIKGTQHTITWHMHDLKSSHVNPKVNDKFLDWLKTTYANDKIGEIKAVCGKKHNYLAMTLNLPTRQECITSFIKLRI